jgi:thiol peroxidase
MNPHTWIAAWAGCLAVILTAGPAAAEEEARPMKTEQLIVTMKGKPVVLSGTPVATGAPAPDFRAVDGGFKPVRLSDFTGRVVLISAVPSLDTALCSLQTKRFNEEAARLPSNVVVLAISADLPFAQKRFCEAEKVDRIRTLSDCVWRDFGMKYGVLIENMGLLARSIWVVAADGRVAYCQIVPEITTHPDYDAALKAARDAASMPWVDVINKHPERP